MPKSKEAHGSRYHYCSPNTDLLGWIIEKVTGTSFGNYFSKEIFQKCNPQYNAFITLDHENSPRTAGGICMVIDDLAQVAEMVCDWYAIQSEMGTDFRSFIRKDAPKRWGFTTTSKIYKTIKRFVDLLLDPVFK